MGVARRRLVTGIAVLAVGLVIGVVFYRINAAGEALPESVTQYSMSDLVNSEHGVLYDSDRGVFVVLIDDGIVVLTENAKHVADDVVRYCPSSGMFEGPYHGERFDRHGRYFAGPASSDMDSISSLSVEGDRITVDFIRIDYAALRSPKSDPPLGASCMEGLGEPGFYTG